jgi:hypothetical protein
MKRTRIGPSSYSRICQAAPSVFLAALMSGLNYDEGQILLSALADEMKRVRDTNDSDGFDTGKLEARIKYKISEALRAS